jgi:hypothetical protein
MSRITTLIVAVCFFNFKSFAFEPYSGISCHNSIVKGKVEFFFKHDENYIYATAYKRVNGEFIKVGNVVGQKVSSFILFEDNTIDKNLNFAWHIDMVTKNLKPFILTVNSKNKFKIPDMLECISKNFWF